MELLNIVELIAHKQNPRFIQKDHVHNLAVSMQEYGFKQCNAILVRPFGGGYQIVSGHHRVEAAKEAGIAKIPSHVEEMDDDEALMRLVTENSQKELSALEIGMHMLNVIPKGKHAGMDEYSKRVGLEKRTLRDIRNGVLVLLEYAKTADVRRFEELCDKVYHASIIGGLKSRYWVDAVQWMIIECDLSCNKIRQRVKIASKKELSDYEVEQYLRGNATEECAKAIEVVKAEMDNRKMHPAIREVWERIKGKLGDCLVIEVWENYIERIKADEVEFMKRLKKTKKEDEEANKEDDKVAIPVASQEETVEDDKEVVVEKEKTAEANQKEIIMHRICKNIKQEWMGLTKSRKAEMLKWLNDNQ